MPATSANVTPERSTSAVALFAGATCGVAGPGPLGYACGGGGEPDGVAGMGGGAAAGGGHGLPGPPGVRRPARSGSAREASLLIASKYR